MTKPTLSFKQRMQWLSADMETPISVWTKLIGAGHGILLESAEVDGRWGRYSILATNMCFFASCRDGNLALEIKNKNFSAISAFNGMPFMDGMRALLNCLTIEAPEKMKDLPPITRAFYGYLGFGMVSIFHPHLQSRLPVSEAECCLAFPATVLVFDHLYNRLCLLELFSDEKIAEKLARQCPQEAPTFAKTEKAQNDGENYKAYVRAIREMLRQGEAIQVVPSQRFSLPFTGNPFQLYRRMRRFNASPYMFYMNLPDLALFGSSPEVMVRATENVLQLSPIAGTRKRGASREKDDALAAELLADPKERAEHVMLVDLGRNDLGKIAKTGTVKVEKFMEVEKFSHVMHLTSNLSAILDRGNGRPRDALDVLAATFPAGTVSGAPKFRAIEIIRELEQTGRGPYAGCIGWIGLDRNAVNMDMGITLRSMWLKDGQLCWQTGGGIVHDSDPDLEWEEVRNKSAIMRLALMQEDEENVSFNR